MPKLSGRFVGIARVVAAATLVATVLTGCARLPLAGEVRQGPLIDGGLSGEQLYYSPNPPSTGASQEDIINGFLNAGTGPQDDYAVAREYLSDKFRSQWQPNQEVLVETGRPEISFAAAGRAQVSILLQSKLDERGIYSVAREGTARTLDFSFVREHGEWRLSSAPNLTVLIRPIFDAIFHSYSLYFFDNQFKYLVPDVRWFPARASTSTRMVTELFRGPSDWLAPAVSTAIPAGMKLSLSSVSVANGQAAVDLNSKFLSLTAIQKVQLKSQLSATLDQLASVNQVQILVERSPQTINDVDARATSMAPSSPVLLTNDSFKHLTGSVPPNFNQISGLAQTYEAVDFALSADEKYAALRAPDGVHLVLLSSIGTTPLLVDSRAKLIRPVFDRQGYLWSTGQTAGSQVRAIGLDGTAYTVAASWLALANREEVAISPEGARIAARIKTPSGDQVWVSTILRDRTGRPTALGKPIQLMASAKTPISIGWAGDSTVAVLDDNDGVRAIAYLATIGADSTATVGIENGVRILSSPVGELYALTRFGELDRYQSSNWERAAQSVVATHFAGQ